MRSALITTAAWTIALVVVTWQRLLKPALLTAFPGADALFTVSHSETHETRPPEACAAPAPLPAPAPAPRTRRRATAAASRSRRRSAAPTAPAA